MPAAVTVIWSLHRQLVLEVPKRLSDRLMLGRGHRGHSSRRAAEDADGAEAAASMPQREAHVDGARWGSTSSDVPLWYVAQ